MGEIANNIAFVRKIPPWKSAAFSERSLHRMFCARLLFLNN